MLGSSSQRWFVSGPPKRSVAQNHLAMMVIRRPAALLAMTAMVVALMAPLTAYADVVSVSFSDTTIAGGGSQTINVVVGTGAETCVALTGGHTVSKDTVVSNKTFQFVVTAPASSGIVSVTATSYTGVVSGNTCTGSAKVGASGMYTVVVPPGTPGTPTAVPGDASVSLSWASPDSGGTVAMYEVGRSTDGTNWTVLSDFVLPGFMGGNSYGDSTAVNGTAYRYRVRAQSGGMWGAYSSVSSPVTPLAAPGAPGKPSVTAGDNQVAVSWTAPSTGAAVASYEVSRGDEMGMIWNLVSGASALTILDFTDTGVANGTKYRYRVRAKNSNNTYGDFSTASDVVTPVAPVQPPATPTGLVATAVDGQVMLSWDAVSGATAYTVRYRVGDGSYTEQATASAAAVIMGLVNGTQYEFSVRAENSGGNSGYSSPVSATPAPLLSVPGAPGTPSVTAGNGQVALSWAAPSSGGAPASYELSRSSNGGSNWSVVTDASALAAALFTDTTVINGTTYIYRVRAQNATGFGSYSSSSANAAPQAPAAPVAGVSPASKTFSDTTVGSSSATETFTVSNTGLASFAISSVGLFGDAGHFTIGTNNCITTLVPLIGLCTLQVTYTPTGTGSHSAELRVAHDATGSPLVVTLTGTGTAVLSPAASVTPSAEQDFGSVTTNTITNARDFVVSNSGTGTLSVTSATLTGGNAGQFSMTANNCNGASLTGAATCTVSVAFAPTQEGTKTAKLSIVHGAAGSPTEVTLTGTGTAPADNSGGNNNSGGNSNPGDVSASGTTAPPAVVVPSAPAGGGIAPITIVSGGLGLPAAATHVEVPLPVGTAVATIVGGQGQGYISIAPTTSALRAPNGLDLLAGAVDIQVVGVTFEKVRICLPYDESALPPGTDERTIQLLHYLSNGRSENITLRVNVRANLVCGETDSFSPFALAIPKSAVRAAGGPAVERVGGSDAVRAASNVADAKFVGNVPVVYVATGANFADALALGPAATPNGAPILLVYRDEVPDVTRAALQRMRPERIVILGGTSAISTDVEKVLATYASKDVSRVAGSDRYDTAAKLLSTHFTGKTPVVFVASGDNFPDAIAGGAAAAKVGAPVVLVRPGSIPAASAAELRRLAPQKILVLGGRNAISAGVLAELAQFASDSVQRLSGPDRFATAVRISRELFPAGAKTVYLAAGHNFAHALAGVPAAAREGAPILFTQTGAIPAIVREELERLAPERIVILGARGTAAAFLRGQVAEIQRRSGS